MLWLFVCGCVLVIVFVAVFVTVTENKHALAFEVGREHCQADLAVELRRGTLPADARG